MGPRDCLIVGVEDDPNGMLRVYIDHRSYGHYVLIEDEEDKERARRAWDMSYQGHLFMKRPPSEAVYSKPPSRAPGTEGA